MTTRIRNNEFNKFLNRHKVPKPITSDKQLKKSVATTNMQREFESIVGERISMDEGTHTLLLFWDESWQAIKDTNIAADEFLSYRVRLVEIARIMGSLQMITPQGASRAFSAISEMAKYWMQNLLRQGINTVTLTLKLQDLAPDNIAIH